MKRSRLLPAAILVLAVILQFAWYYNYSENRAARLSLGDSLPPHVQSMIADLRPNGAHRAPLIVFYGSPSCSHCRAELARWARLAALSPDVFAGLRIVIMARERVDLLAIEAGDLSVDTVGDAAGSLQERLGVRAYPTIFFVDSASTIRFRQVGEFTSAALASALETIVQPQFAMIGQ